MVFQPNNLKTSSGFSLIELLAVVTVTALLAAVITVNFSTLREQQEVSVATSDLISKIREVQNFVLSGRVIPGAGVPANAYEIIFATNATSYEIKYVIAGATSTLEVVNLPQKTKISQVFLGATPRAQISILLDSPFANLSIEGVSNSIGEIQLGHTSSSRTSSVVVDAISGRIGKK